MSPKQEKLEQNKIESADTKPSADFVKHEVKEIKKQVLTSSSLDVLETQIDQTITGVDAKKGLESLGKEVDYSKINSKVENENKLTTLSQQVDIITSNPDRTIQQTVEMNGEMPIEAFNTYVGFNIIGSLYAAVMKKAGKADGSVDSNMLENLLSGYDMKNISGLKNALTQSGAVLDEKEKQIIAFLEGNSTFAKEYMSTQYAGVLSLMQKHMPNMIQQYNTYVLANPSTGNTFLQKTKNVVNNIVEDFKKHPVRDVALLAGGFLVGRWIYRKITGKKKKKDTESETKSSGFSKFLKGALKVGGIACVAVLLWKMMNGLATGNPFNINNQPGDLVDKNDKEKFLKLDPEEVKKYNDMAEKINGYYVDEVHSDGNKSGIEGDDDMFGESIYEKYEGVDIKGVVPYVIDKRYATLGHLLDEKAITLEIINGDINAFLSSIRQWCGDKAETLLGPILSKLGNFPAIFGGKKWNTDAVFDWIKGNTEAQDQLRSMFTKIMKMIAYFKNREDELIKVTSADFVKKEFLGKNILQAYTVLQEKGIEKAVLDEEQKEVLEGLTKMKSKYNEVLKPLDVKITFEKSDCEDVIELCDDVTDEMNDTGKRNVMQRMASTLTGFSNSDEMALDQMLDGIGYSELIKPYKEKISAIKDKATKGTITKEDVKELHTLIDDYTNLMKDIMIGKMTIEEVKDENGSKLGRFGRWLKVNGKDMFMGFEMMIDGFADGDWMKAIGGTGIVASKAVIVYAVLRPKSFIKGTVKASSKIVVGTYKAGQKILFRAQPGLGSRLSAESMQKIFGAKNAMEMNNIIRVNFLKGSLSETQAIRMLKKLGIRGSNGNTIATPQLLYEHIFGRQFSTQEMAVLQKYAGNDLIRAKLYTKDFAGTWKDRIKLRRKVNTDIFLHEANLQSLLKLDQSILSIATKPGVTAESITYTQKCATSLLKHADDLGKATPMIEKMIANPMKGLIDAEKFGRILGKNASTLGEQGLIEITQFIQKAKVANKIVSNEKFVVNAIRNYSKIKAANFELSVIDNLSLNKGRASRFIETTGKWSEGAKDGLLRIKEGLKKTPNGLSQAWNKLQQTLKGIDPARVPASMRPAVVAELNEANAAIQEGKTTVATLEQNLAASRLQTTAAEQTAESLAQLESKQISTLQKVLKNKVVQRLIKYSPALLELGFAAWSFSDAGKEIDELKKTNEGRADVKDDHRYFDLGVTTVGATVMIIGIANGRNPVGRAILGVGLTIEGVKKIGEFYYEVVESYYKNMEEFRREYMGTIKQELISKSASGQGVEISFKENHQQFWASIGGALGIDTFTGAKKNTQTVLTLEHATRALVYMEEIERFPLADMDKNLIDATTVEGKELLEKIEKDKKGIIEAVNKRFAYILSQRPSLRDVEKPSLLSKEAFGNNGHALDEINLLLSNSRKSVRTEQADFAAYEKGELQSLQQNKHDFDKFELLWKNNRRDIQSVAHWLGTYESMIENYKDNNEQYTAIKEKIAYFKQYYNYKTFGVINSDLPLGNQQLQDMEPDMNMVENMLLNGEVVPSVIKKEDILPSIQNGKLQLNDAIQTAENMAVSPILGQQIFYRIAKEIMGYTGDNNLQDLKVFYSEKKDDTNGIYHLENSWYFNIAGDSRLTSIDDDRKICDDKDLGNKEVFEGLKKFLLTAGQSVNLQTATRSGDPTINKEFSAKKIQIVSEELAMKTPEKQRYVKDSIEKFVKERGKDGYVQLPSELVSEAIRAGFTDVGSCLYTVQGNAIVCIAPSYAQSTFKNGKHSLGYTVEYIQTTNESVDAGLNTIIALTDNSHDELYRMVVEEKNSDFDFNAAIISLVKEKSAVRKSLKQKILASKGNNQSDIQKMKEMQKQFENIFTGILSIGSGGSSNDVDKTEHFEKILTLQSVDLVSLSMNATNINYTFADGSLDGQYQKEVQKLCRDQKYVIPGTTKTIEDYYREGDDAKKKIAIRAANILMQCVMESAMLRYDAVGRISEIYGWGDRDISKERLPIYIKKRFTKENIGI